MCVPVQHRKKYTGLKHGVQKRQEVKGSTYTWLRGGNGDEMVTQAVVRVKFSGSLLLRCLGAG